MNPSLQALEVWLQEEVLDAVEAFVAELTTRAAAGSSDVTEAYLSIEPTRGGITHYVDIRLLLDHPAQHAVVLGVDYLPSLPFI